MNYKLKYIDTNSSACENMINAAYAIITLNYTCIYIYK